MQLAVELGRITEIELNEGRRYVMLSRSMCWQCNPTRPPPEVRDFRNHADGECTIVKGEIEVQWVAHLQCRARGLRYQGALEHYVDQLGVPGSILFMQVGAGDEGSSTEASTFDMPHVRRPSGE